MRGEGVDDVYTTGFVTSLFDRESGGLFDVHGAVLGQVQQGGAPSPFDRIQATRLAAAGRRAPDRAGPGRPAGERHGGACDGEVAFTPLAEFGDLRDDGARRPRQPTWWMALRPIADLMAAPRPTANSGP